MQTVTAPSRSSLLGSLKNSFAASGVTSSVSAQVPSSNSQAPIQLTDNAIQTSGSQQPSSGNPMPTIAAPQSTLDQVLVAQVPIQPTDNDQHSSATDPKPLNLAVTTPQQSAGDQVTSTVQAPISISQQTVTQNQRSVNETANVQTPMSSNVSTQTTDTIDESAVAEPEIALSDEVKTQIFENVLQDVETKAEVEAQSLFNTEPMVPNVPAQAPTDNVQVPTVANQVLSTADQGLADQAPMASSIATQVPTVSTVGDQLSATSTIDPLSQAPTIVNEVPVDQVPTANLQVPNVTSPVPSTTDQGPQEDFAANTATMGQLAITLDATPASTLNPPVGAPTAHKEALGGSPLVVEANTGGGSVEAEPFKEIPPEIESYIQKVESHDQLPQEIAIANGDVTLSPVQYPAQPVIVLPITAEVEEEAAKKSPEFSIRWLKEFCGKVIKMFAGKVVYKSQE